MKYTYLVHPGYLDENEMLLASFPTEKEAETHRAAREAAGEYPVYVQKVPHFDSEYPPSTVIYFETADISPVVGGVYTIRGRNSWEENYWHYQYPPPTKAKAKADTDPKRPGFIRVMGTDKEAVKNLLIKEIKKHVGNV